MRERGWLSSDGHLHITRAGEDSSFEGWLDGLEAGRTFVTNGPMPDMTVEGSGIGEILTLEGPSTVRVQAEVWFDPERDRVDAVELVRNGEVIARVDETSKPGRMVLAASPRIDASAWIAVRTEGKKSE